MHVLSLSHSLRCGLVILCGCVYIYLCSYICVCACVFGSTAKIWDASSGTLLRTLSGHSGYVFSVAWSPDGTRLASGSKDKYVWVANGGRVLFWLVVYVGMC